MRKDILADRSGVRVALGGVLIAVVLAACGDDSGSRSEGPGGEVAAPEADAGGLDPSAMTAPNAAGFAIQGAGWFPPLLRRVEQRECPESSEADPACRTDADCADGQACICGRMDGGPSISTCVSAECASDADCEGACLLSYPPAIVTDLECVACGLGLFCERPGSTCMEGCPGNGRGCIYVLARDRFECGPQPS